MIKTILRWTEAKSNSACCEEGAVGLAKCAGIGAIEGAIDAVAVIGVTSIVCAVIGAFKS